MAETTMAVTGLAILYVAILLFKGCSAYWTTHDQRTRKRRSGTIPNLGDSTILQPILSGDPKLQEMLAANLASLPNVHFFWLIDEADAAASVITASLMRQFPSANISVLRFPEAPEGVNPKSFKLEGAWRQVTTPVCVILDDDSQISAETLAALIEAADRGVLATALPHYLDDGFKPSQLLAQFVNNNAILTYLSLLPYAEPMSINGMCYAIRTEHLKKLDGFSSIQHHLADDLALANLVQSKGGSLKQIFDPVSVQTSVRDLPHYCRQMHRWFLFATLLLKRQTVPRKLLIFSLHGIHPIILWGLFILCTADPEQLFFGADMGVLACTLVFRGAFLATLQKHITGAVRHRPAPSIVSELLQPLHLMHSVLVRGIQWRTRRYRVFDNDRFISQ